MIKCRGCMFEVQPGMRHALVNNCCPSCGGALFGNVHMNRLKLFKEKVLQQKFSEGLSKDDVFDIALFILTEFFPVKPADSEEEDAKEDPVLREEDAEESQSYESIRDEVRMEKLSEADEADDLDLDLKVARLKRLAKESPALQRGPSVRRITND